MFALAGDKPSGTAVPSPVLYRPSFMNCCARWIATSRAPIEISQSVMWCSWLALRTQNRFFIGRQSPCVHFCDAREQLWRQLFRWQLLGLGVRYRFRTNQVSEVLRVADVAD